VGLSPERVEEIKRRDLPVIEGSPADPSVLERAGAASAMALVSLTADDEMDLAACRLAGDRFGIPNRVAMVGDQAVAAEMSHLGVRVVQPQLATALALEGALHFPSAFDMLANHTDGVEIREGVLNNPPLEGRPLRRVQMPGDVLVIGMRRGDDVLVPHGNTVLHQGDVLMLVGHPDELHQAMAWLCPPCY
jgi:Trk K+ transport system NAD-binding subunit